MQGGICSRSFPYYPLLDLMGEFSSYGRIQFAGVRSWCANVCDFIQIQCYVMLVLVTYHIGVVKVGQKSDVLEKMYWGNLIRNNWYQWDGILGLWSLNYCLFKKKN